MKKGLLLYPLLVTATILLFSLAACTSTQAETAMINPTTLTPKPTSTAMEDTTATPTLIPETSTPTPTEIPPTETAAPAGPPPLAYIAMIDELNGWGLNKRSNLLKTNDGGITWEKAVIKPKGAPKPSPRVFFLDANNAWVVNNGAEGALETVFRTNDAGLTWQSTTVPFRLGQILFI